MLFFHKVVSGRRQINIITLGMVGLDEVTYLGDLKGFVIKAFKGYFQSNKGIHVH